MARRRQCKRALTKSHHPLDADKNVIKNSHALNRVDNMKNGTGYLQISTSMTRHYISSRALHRLDFNVLSPPIWNKKELATQPYTTYSRHYTLVSPQHRLFNTETSYAKARRLTKREK